MGRFANRPQAHDDAPLRRGQRRDGWYQKFPLHLGFGLGSIFDCQEAVGPVGTVARGLGCGEWLGGAVRAGWEHREVDTRKAFG